MTALMPALEGAIRGLRQPTDIARYDNREGRTDGPNEGFDQDEERDEAALHSLAYRDDPHSRSGLGDQAVEFHRTSIWSDNRTVHCLTRFPPR